MLYPLVTFARLDKIDSTESSKREQPNVRAASAAFTLNCWQKANIHSLFVFTVYWPIADDDDDSIDALQCGTTKPNTHRFVCPFVRNLHTHTPITIHSAREFLCCLALLWRCTAPPSVAWRHTESHQFSHELANRCFWAFLLCCWFFPLFSFSKNQKHCALKNCLQSTSDSVGRTVSSFLL